MTMAKKKTKYKLSGRDSEAFIVRFPDGMRDAIRFLAERNRRSMNSEIIISIEDHLRRVEEKDR